ncbi:MAG: hypothetical protein A3K03_01760 [Bdellovibrionales bacterium RIFOXYD1_FULL_44_7]|nr:MAG: hypothetical protein A3K03_01760 [Bdellovibrionales bacterium RIFOXYD1_FULL_44_7]
MKRTKGMIIAVLGIALLATNSASAAKFSNQFTEFELPPQWQCNLEGAEWVCQSTNETKKRDAIIVLAAKLKGDQDSLDQYLAYLKAAKTFTSVVGKPVKSDPKYAKTVNINGQAWVDALHMESEIPGFYTRYFATVKDDIGVLVTYSISKTKYQQYLPDFDNLVKTLKVFRKKGPGLNAAPANGNIFKDTTIPQTVSENTVFPGGANPAGGADTPKPKQQELPWLVIILVVGAVGFIIWRKKRSSAE